MSDYALNGRYGDGIDWNLNFADQTFQTDYTMFKAASIPNYCLIGLGIVVSAVFTAYWGTEAFYVDKFESFDFFFLSLVLTVVPVWLVIWLRRLLFSKFEYEELNRNALIFLESWTILVTTMCMSLVVFSRTEHLPVPLSVHQKLLNLTKGNTATLVSSVSVAILLFLPMLSSIFFSFALVSAVVVANIVSYTTIVGCVIFVSSTSTAIRFFAVMLILSVIQYFYRLQQMRLYIYTRIHFKGIQEREHERTEAAERLKNETRNLIASMCHDLKTPITALGAAIESMKAQQGKVLEIIDSSNHTLPEFVRELVDSMHGPVVELAATYHMLLATVNQSTDFTKTAYGVPLAPTLEIVDLRTVFSDLNDFITGLNDNHALIIEPVPENIDLQIITDRQWLLDNMMALASNGVKYSSTSHVNLRVTLCHDGANDEHSSSGGEDFLRFEFCNTGLVIPSENLQSLFDEFPDFSQQRSIGGVGLSLYCISKRIQSMHGKYGAEPLPNRKGMMFWFTIPYRPDGHNAQLAPIEMIGSPDLLAVLSQSRESSHNDKADEEGEEENMEEELGEYESHQSSSPQQQQRASYDNCMLPETSSGKESDSYPAEEPVSYEEAIRVLLVDDSPLLLKMLSREIKSVRNFEVYTCSTGTEAVVKVFPDQLLMKKQSRSSSSDTTEEKGLAGGEGISAVGIYDEMMSEATEAITYDLILMDLQMPVMDGFTAIRAIRAAEQEHHTIHHLIVAMSANSDQRTVQDAYNAGADYFVPKPFKMDTLQQMVIRKLEAGRESKEKRK